LCGIVAVEVGAGLCSETSGHGSRRFPLLAFSEALFELLSISECRNFRGEGFVRTLSLDMKDDAIFVGSSGPASGCF